MKDVDDLAFEHAGLDDDISEHSNPFDSDDGPPSEAGPGDRDAE